jgi:hypothetical protein
MKKLITGLVVLGVAASVLYSISRPKPDALIMDRVWVERMPEGPRDMVLHFIMVDQKRARPGGALIRASMWRQLVEGFKWRMQGDLLEIGFPQEGGKARVKTKAWRCEGKAPKPFQLCLVLAHDGHKLKLYSRDDWKVRDGDELTLPSGLELELPDGEADFDLDTLPLGQTPLTR